MGSGKTCTAIGAVEQIRKEGKFQGALYLAKGDALVNNYANILDKVFMQPIFHKSAILTYN